MTDSGTASLTAAGQNLLFSAHLAVNYCRYLSAKRSHPAADDIIVSLTTYPARFNTCIHAVRSILRQTCRPFGVELYVYRQDIEKQPLPGALTDLTDAGLTIVTVARDQRSYGKLVPALERWPDKSIVTADDDKLYPPNWLAELVDKHRQMPDVIVCQRARMMNGGSDLWQPYVDWAECHDATASAAVFPLGVGGVLYPPQSLHPEVADIDTARTVAPTSDDIWFKVMAWRNGTRHCQVSHRPMKYVSIPNFAGVPLHKKNLRGGNDAALARMADSYRFVPSAVLKD